jgi:hypothetical protein
VGINRLEKAGAGKVKGIGRAKKDKKECDMSTAD